MALVLPKDEVDTRGIPKDVPKWLTSIPKQRRTEKEAIAFDAECRKKIASGHEAAKKAGEHPEQ